MRCVEGGDSIPEALNALLFDLPIIFSLITPPSEHAYPRFQAPYFV